LTAIPIVLLIGPALGYYLGTAADRRWAWGPWGMVVGIALGLAASFRVTLQMIRRSGEMDRDG
jgi:F0F1-type ATP synthase assembly protein I